jgi:chemotaxis protein MotC
MTVLRSGMACMLALGAALPAAASGTDMDAALEPYQIVRSLELVQDRLAGGDHASQPMQRKLLEMIDSRFATREGARFDNELNRRALLVYAMSGGNPDTVKAALEHLGQDDPNRALGEKILFYVNGQPTEAKEAFASVDPMATTPDVGMYLALVKGSMLAEAEPTEALALLDRARLLGPGTLVEEAALRRSLAIAAVLGDASRFLKLAENYVRTYLRSPYASQFADAFVAGVVQLDGTIDRSSVKHVTALMDSEQETVIYLRIARRAAIDGLTELAAFAAKEAEAVDKDPRAELYAGLSSVTSGNVGQVIDKLSRIDRDRLSDNDRQLLDAATAIAASLTAAPAGMKQTPAAAETSEVRGVGPEPIPPPAQTPADQPQAALPAAAPGDTAPYQTEQGDALAKNVDTAAEQADAVVAATRAKLADIDRLIGEMPR